MFRSIPELIEKIDCKEKLTEADLSLIKQYLLDLELHLYNYLKDRCLNIRVPKILTNIPELSDAMEDLVQDIEKIYTIEELVGTPEDWKNARPAEEVFADLKAMLKEKEIRGNY